MQQFKGLIITCALTLLCSTAIAQVTVVIDNKTIPTDHISSISILKNTNVVSISTTVDYTVEPTVVGDDVAITSFYVTPATVEQNETATLSWTSENADQCTASGGVGSWGGTVALSGSEQVTTDVVGPQEFILTCTGPVGDPAVRNTTLTVNLANAVAITSFSASPVSIVEGESTMISWVTENATSCTPSQGTAEWLATDITLPSGSVEITIAENGSYLFSLTCEGDIGDPVNDSAAVSVTAVGQCAEPVLSGTTVEWQSFFGSAFPGPTYKNVATTIGQNSYRAIRFETADIDSFGRFQMAQTVGSPIVLLGAISECPGDFDVEPICDKVWGLGGDLTWSTVSDYRTCYLDDNTTYYLNLTFTDGVDPATTTCDSSICRTTVNYKNY